MLNKKIHRDNQGKFHEGMYITALTHGSEIWTLQENKNK